MKKQVESNGPTFRTMGLKNTPHRRLVYEWLKRLHRPLKAEEIYKALQEQQVAISLSTIYRILDAFAEKGLVTRATIGNEGTIYFEIPHDHHTHHLICLKCHEVIHFENCPIQSLVDQLGKQHDYTIVDHQVDVYGYCPKCERQKGVKPV